MVESNRPKRIPLGTRNLLTAPNRAGFIRRFVNDEGERVKDYESAGYTIVRENIRVGDAKAGKETKIGSAVNPSVGAGTKAVLMEIKEEFYNEDQKKKSDRIKLGENDMKRQLNSNRDGIFGKVEINSLKR